MSEILQWTGSNLEAMKRHTGYFDSPSVNRFRDSFARNTPAELLVRGVWEPVPIGYFVVKLDNGDFVIVSASPTPLRPEDFPTGHEYVPTHPEPRTEVINGVIHTDFRGGPCTTCEQPYEAHHPRSQLPPVVRQIVDRLMEAAGASVDLRQSLNDHLDQYVVRRLHEWFNAEAEGAFLYGSHVVREVGGCTCAGDLAGYGHEPHCGLEPLFQVKTTRHDGEVLRKAAAKAPPFSEPVEEWLQQLAGRIEAGQEEGW